MIALLALLCALWPAIAHAQDAGGLPLPGSWWEAVLGAVMLILTGGYGGSTLIGRMKQPGASAPDSELAARIKAIEEAGRASKEQAAAADRDKRLGEVEAKVAAMSAEIGTLRAMVSQASERTTAGLDSVAGLLKRLEGGG